MSELLWIGASAGGTWLGWRARKPGLVVLCGAAAMLLVVRVVREVVGWLGAVGLLSLLVTVAAGGAVVCYYRFAHSRAVVTRWGDRVRRQAGVASTLDILRFGSALTVRRQGATVRPSLAMLTRWERARLATTEVGIPLCRAGLLQVWSSIEDVVLVFGGPRFGKSGWLGCQILDAPGAVVATSVRSDLHDETSVLRAQGGPVWVFNPTGDGPSSTISFDPVAGCDDPVTAAERAEDMLPCGQGDAEREYWVGQARQVFAALLHAAALGGRSMQTVAEWVAAPDTARGDVAQLLRRSGDLTGSYATVATQFFTTNDRTRSSIATSIRPALTWLTNQHARAVTVAGVQFDVAELLQSRGTLYLIGAKDGQARALLAALTGHIARQARHLAAQRPKGRLDPHLTLALDEVKLSCPIPLDQWTADMGGRGVHIIACFQSRSQLVGLWGASGAAEITNNAGAVMVFGGTKDETDLRYWSTLFGTRDEQVITTGPDGQVSGCSVRQVPVFSPAQLSALPRFKVVVIRRYMAPVIGRAAMMWERRDVRAQERATTRSPARRPVPTGAGGRRPMVRPSLGGVVSAGLVRSRTGPLLASARRRAQMWGAL